jgi:curved DNA-binding protein CbpA
MEAADVESLWAKALELSEDGQVHEAVLSFEQAAALLDTQKEQALQTKGADRVRQLLDELIAKLGREIESHLNYLRGNLWAALDLGPGASSSDVKRAYKRLALKYHPDKSRVSPKIFTIVGRAREVLGDAERRRYYTPERDAAGWRQYRREHAAEFRVAATPARRNAENAAPARGRRDEDATGAQNAAPRRRRAGDATGAQRAGPDRRPAAGAARRSAADAEKRRDARRRDAADEARRRRPSLTEAKKSAAAAAQRRYGAPRDGPGAAAARAYATGTREAPLMEARVQNMNIGELKASLRRSGLPATGERRDLERDVLRAAGLRPKTPVPPHVAVARLRAASPASRATIAAALPEALLRDLLRQESAEVSGNDLVAAAVAAFGEEAKEDEDSFFDDRSDGPDVAFARPASSDSDVRRPRDPRFVRPHVSPASSSDDSGVLPGEISNSRGGFVGALRGRTSRGDLGDLGPTHVAAAPGVQDEVEFWLDGAARARTPRRPPPEPPPEVAAPEVVADGGAWFWGDT